MIRKQLPKAMPAWAKLRIDGFRTTIRSAMAMSTHDTGRDASYIRVSLDFYVCSNFKASLIIYCSILVFTREMARTI